MNVEYDSGIINPSGNEGMLYVLSGCKAIIKIDSECISDLDRAGYFYMMSPYSDSQSTVKTSRFLENARLLNYFTSVRIPVLSTISHSHPATLFGSDGGWEYWEKLDKTLMEGSKSLLLVLMQGWDKSIGVKHELEHGETLHIPLNILINYRDDKLHPGKNIYHMIKTSYSSLKHLRNIKKSED